MNQQRNGHDRVAVVTGASQGIGQAFAVRLAETGRRVVLADITDTSETEKLARHAGAEVLSVHTDVSDEQSVAHLRRQVEGTFGGTDILVNNAGTPRWSSGGG
jgi:NAD(P)-dependent dehydrogenase (short-subunit alcohol dehydrogenase family)